MYGSMRLLRGASRKAKRSGEAEISEAAIRTFGRVLATMADRITTRPYGDGGLICEERTSRARPSVWRISADGAVVPASVLRRSAGHVSGPLPQVSR